LLRARTSAALMCSNGSKVGMTLIDVIPRSGTDRRSIMNALISGQVKKPRPPIAFGGRLCLPEIMDEDEVRKLRR
jgi:hypothetical protein